MLQPSRRFLSVLCTSLVVLLPDIALPANNESTETLLLRQISAALQTELNQLDKSVAAAAADIAKTDDLGGKAARERLAALRHENARIAVGSTISDRGILVAIEPSKFAASEKSDISTQSHVIKIRQTLKPIMSDLFPAVEGFPAVAVHHPMIIDGGNFRGAVSVLFKPADLISEVVEPMLKDPSLLCWLVQPDGTIVYDRDTSQIGLNLFTSALYAPYQSLRKLGREIVEKPAGHGTYQFLRTGTTVPIEKHCQWTTVGIHGKEWRVVLTLQ